MKKKYFVLLVFLILFNLKTVNALSQNELTILNLDLLGTNNKPLGFTSVQGGTTTNKYVITLLINDDKDYSDNKTAIMVLNKNNYKLVRLVENPIVKYKFGHANDSTYNSKTNELLILSGRKINFLDLTNDKFELTKKKKLKHYYHGLGYDDISDSYVLSRGIKGGTLFEIRDSEFKLINKFKIKTNLTRQSLTVHNGYIYYVCYEAGMLTKHQKVYDGILKRKENLVYVYSLEGKKKNIYYIPFSYNNIVYGEIENISFNEDRMLMQFNHSDNIGYFTADYNSIVDKNVKIETEEDSEYTIYEEDIEKEKVKSKNKLIPINLKFNKEGNYKYRILKTDDLDIGNPNSKELEVNVYYDPVTNKMKAKTNAKDLIFTKNFLTTKEDKDTLIVDVPDTKSNNYLWIIGLIIISFGCKYICKEEI